MNRFLWKTTTADVKMRKEGTDKEEAGVSRLFAFGCWCVRERDALI